MKDRYQIINKNFADASSDFESSSVHSVVTYPSYWEAERMLL